MLTAAFLVLRRYGLHNTYILACLDRHIPILGQYIAIISRSRVTYNDIPLLAGNRNALPGGDILSYQDIAIFPGGLHAHIVACGHGSSYGNIALNGSLHVHIGIGLHISAYGNITFTGGNVNAALLTAAFLVLRRYGLHNTYILACLDRHIPILGQYIAFARGHVTYSDSPLLAGNRNGLPGSDVLSYQDIALNGSLHVHIVACSHGCSYGNIAIIPGGFHAHIVACSHGCSYGNAAISNNRRTHIPACTNAISNKDTSFTGLQRYISILGLYGLGYNDAALAGNIRNDIPGSGDDISFYRDISFSLHIEACFVTRRKRSCTHFRAAFRLHTFRQSTNVDARLR